YVGKLPNGVPSASGVVQNGSSSSRTWSSQRSPGGSSASALGTSMRVKSVETSTGMTTGVAATKVVGSSENTPQTTRPANTRERRYSVVVMRKNEGRRGERRAKQGGRKELKTRGNRRWHG